MFCHLCVALFQMLRKLWIFFIGMTRKPWCNNKYTNCCYPIFDPCFNNFSKNKKIKNKNKNKGLHVATT